jgi:hypothetical protein
VVLAATTFLWKERSALQEKSRHVVRREARGDTDANGWKQLTGRERAAVDVTIESRRLSRGAGVMLGHYLNERTSGGDATCNCK